MLVCPIRVVERYGDLTEAEMDELWLAARKVGSTIQRYYRSKGMIYAVQDGSGAGQSIHHVHMHIMPKKEEGKVYSQQIDDESMPARGEAEMTNEAGIYRSLI